MIDHKITSIKWVSIDWKDGRPQLKYWLLVEGFIVSTGRAFKRYIHQDEPYNGELISFLLRNGRMLTRPPLHGLDFEEDVERLEVKGECYVPERLYS